LCYNLSMHPLIRASEIGSYLYCRRAWWYRKQGVESENQSEMATGTELHRQHGRRVIAAGLLRILGLILLLAAFVLLVAALTSSILK
jgi:CRISPR/Cas system-associated exonuclease Cas4 (RecB family)